MKVDLRDIGQRGLAGQGLRGRILGRAAGPIARRTRFTEEQVRAAIGWALLAITAYQFLRTMRRTVASTG